MPMKAFTPEQVVQKLWQSEMLLDQGWSIFSDAKEAGITDQTSYRWR